MLDRESIRNGAVERMVREGERHGLGTAWTGSEAAATTSPAQWRIWACTPCLTGAGLARGEWRRGGKLTW